MEYKERKRWLFLGLPFTFTKHTATLAEKVVGLGTVVCYTGDTTYPKLILSHIKKSREIKDFILKASEEARLKRRTVNMLDIGSGGMEDIHDL